MTIQEVQADSYWNSETIATDEYGAVFFQKLGQYVFDRGFESSGHDKLDRDISERCYFWVNYVDFCQSPIEKRLFAHLLFCTDGYEHLRCPAIPISATRTDTILEPQGEILGFHADFLIKIQLKHLVSHLVIECDGHDFHERTKFQAARDKARDRAMTKANVKILRYTGSEIFNSASACAEEITDTIIDMRDALEKLIPGWWCAE